MTGKPTYTRDDVISALQTFYAEHGIVPSTPVWTRHRMRPSANVAIRIFGHWTVALDEAGLPRTMPRPVTADRRGYLKIGGEERAKEGCLTTWENAKGETLTLHCVGFDALREACRIATTKDESYRLVCYSTPQTIYTDIIGLRTGRTHSKNGQKLAKQSPELNMLARINRLELAHPKLRRRSVDARI